MDNLTWLTVCQVKKLAKLRRSDDFLQQVHVQGFESWTHCVDFGHVQPLTSG